jgi:hypothetical protein
MPTWMKDLLARAAGPVGRRATRRMVYLIADRSLDGAREQLSLETSRMCSAELRGYVRARAHCIVRVQAERAAAECGVPAGSFDALVASALDRTVQLVARQPVPLPVMPLPVPHVRLRIAG